MGHDRTAAPDDSDERRRVPRHEEKKSIEADRLLAGRMHLPIVVNYRSSSILSDGSITRRSSCEKECSDCSSDSFE